MDPQAPSSHAEIAAERLLASAGAEPTGEADRKRWLLIIHCLALTRGQHTPNVSTGTVLAQVQYSEERINRLLSSDFEVIADVLPRLARFLGAKGCGHRLAALGSHCPLDWMRRKPRRPIS